MTRDMEKQPYTPDEQRVCQYMQMIAPDLGCGDDPIGFLIACYGTLLFERNEWRECAYYDPLMSGKGAFLGWDRSALDRCRRRYIEKVEPCVTLI